MTDAVRAPAWRARVLTLFPEMFPGPLGHSLAGRALERGDWRLEVMDIRSFALDKHRSVDDTPFGGGPGMVMRPDVVDAALAAAMQPDEGSDLVGPVSAGSVSAGSVSTGPAIYFSPRGRVLDQALVKELVREPGCVMLCGRYEGLDERVIEARGLIEVSLGDFVLSGGEVAALALMDAVVRLIPGVMGAAETLDEESFERGLLEYPHYTRPAVWQGRSVPEVLLSGHHEKINAWRRRQAEEVTRLRRPDLWAAYEKRAEKDEA